MSPVLPPPRHERDVRPMAQLVRCSGLSGVGG